GSSPFVSIMCLKQTTTVYSHIHLLRQRIRFFLPVAFHVYQLTYALLFYIIQPCNLPIILIHHAQSERFYGLLCLYEYICHVLPLIYPGVLVFATWLL